MAPISNDMATRALLGGDNVSEANAEAPAESVLGTQGSFSLVSFLSLFLGTVIIFGVTIAVWRIGSFLRRFSVSRILRPRNPSSPDVRYKKAWYGWVKISPENEHRATIWKNKFIGFWKSILSRLDRQWAWDPEANMRVPRERRWLTRWISKWLRSDQKENVKRDFAVDGVFFAESPYEQPNQVITDIGNMQLPPRQPKPAIIHRDREQKGVPLKQSPELFIDGNNDSSSSQATVTRREDDTATESDFARDNRLTSSESQSTQSSMTGQSLPRHTADKAVKKMVDSSSWATFQPLDKETTLEQKNYRSMPSMRNIREKATSSRSSTIYQKPKALSEGHQIRMSDRLCSNAMNNRSMERLSLAREAQIHRSSKILFQSAGNSGQRSPSSHAVRPAYNQTHTQTRLTVPLRASVRKRNHTRLHVRRRTNSSVAGYKLSKKYRAWSAKMQLQSWPPYPEWNRFEGHAKGLAGRPGSPSPEALKGMISKCSTESSVGRGVEMSSLGFSQSTCAINNAVTEPGQKSATQENNLHQGALQPSENCSQLWLESMPKMNGIDPLDFQAKSPWQSSLLLLPQIPSSASRCEFTSDASPKNVILRPPAKSPEDLSTETTRRFIEKLTDSEVKLLFILARKLDWLSEELSPYRPPFGTFLPFSHWLNRDTWVAYDGASRIAADERRLLGDPKFGGPFCGNHNRNRKKQNIKNRNVVRKRRPGSESRNRGNAQLGPQRKGVEKPRKTAPSHPRNLTRTTNCLSSSIPSSQMSLDKPMTIPDGGIDASAWIIPRPPQGSPRDKNERLIWYEGSGGVFETLEDWQNIGKCYKLKRFVSEGQVNRGRVKEWANNCAEGAKKVKRTLSDRAPTRFSREVEAPSSPPRPRGNGHDERLAASRVSSAQNNDESSDIENRATSRLHGLQVFNWK